MGRQIKTGATVVAEKIDVTKKNLFNEILEPPHPASGHGHTGVKVERRVLADEDSGNPKLDELSYFPSTGDLPLRGEDEDDPFDILSEVEVHASDEDAPITRISSRKERKKTVHEREEEQTQGGKQEEISQDDLQEQTADLPSATPDILAYQRPPYTLLNTPQRHYAAEESPAEKSRMLVETLQSFNISARVINITVGPVITRFELQPAQGVRVNRITTLSDDIALALAAPRVRIEAPIPGKAAIGIEIPNKDIQPVLLREAIDSPEFIAAKSPLCFALGKDIAGKVVCADLDRMPHLLIAGSTGSGKSVCINDIILSMIYHTAPCDLRMILVDPKKVELKVYSPLPHLLLPVVTDAKKAAGALKWAVVEMEQRYQKMSLVNARDLNRYNSLQEDAGDNLPRLVIIIDELADLMMVAAKDVEESICRIAQLGRAAGIHLIVATQRPSTDIITGLIKTNIPSRIALTVSSAVDSRVIMDVSGAEKLLGRGDMLFHANGANKPIRAQAAYVSDEEVERVMDFFSAHHTAPVEQYSEVSLDTIACAGENGPAQGNGKQEDELFPDAVKIVLESGQASISMIQRRLRVGYARAARLIDIMEQKKIVSGFDGSKPRKLLITAADYAEMFGGE
ncbi:MAG: DNA translocase FtsK, partial [Clostridia bacterium]|nr:DNA translocase FtsK [Clostridia bacterium]